MSVEFVCEDCGYTVHQFGLAAAPDPPVCAVCQFIRELPPSEQEEARSRHWS